MGKPVKAPAEPQTRSRMARIVAALRQRDWIGIAIELLVVTVGILMAFQIDQWAQDRQQVREERQFLERMWRETASASEETRWVMTLHGRFRREFIEGFSSLDDPVKLARLADTPNVGCRAGVMPGLGFNNTSFQELSASGSLNKIRNPDVRSALREVVAAQADAEAQRDNAFALSASAQRVLEPFQVLGLDWNDNRTCRLEWSRLASDTEARNALVRSSRLHTLLWNKRAYSLDVLAKAHNAIACELRKPDCRPRVAQIFLSRPRYDIVPAEAEDDIARSASEYNGS